MNELDELLEWVGRKAIHEWEIIQGCETELHGDFDVPVREGLICAENRMYAYHRVMKKIRAMQERKGK